MEMRTARQWRGRPRTGRWRHRSRTPLNTPLCQLGGAIGRSLLGLGRDAVPRTPWGLGGGLAPRAGLDGLAGLSCDMGCDAIGTTEMQQIGRKLTTARERK
jgi:hypothetical protein